MLSISANRIYNTRNGALVYNFEFWSRNVVDQNPRVMFLTIPLFTAMFELRHSRSKNIFDIFYTSLLVS